MRGALTSMNTDSLDKLPAAVKKTIWISHRCDPEPEQPHSDSPACEEGGQRSVHLQGL